MAGSTDRQPVPVLRGLHPVCPVRRFRLAL